MSRIEFENLGIAFDIGSKKGVKDILIPGSQRFSKIESGTINALKSINLTIKDGERLAIIGHNGAGKSTILKVMAGIYAPTTGTVKTQGRVSAMFELATGFEMEQSGWDNIYLRGLMLGETPKGIIDKMQEIAEFSELGEFLNMPVKYYSSGMFIRLAFSVSTAIEPDILLLDEVVASGDAAFIAKAKKRMNDMIEKTKIVVLVTHGMGDAIALCNRCIWMEQGNILMDGTPKDVTEAYTRSVL